MAMHMTIDIMGGHFNLHCNNDLMRHRFKDPVTIPMKLQQLPTVGNVMAPLDESERLLALQVCNILQSFANALSRP
jgi:hypothetical protein